MSSLAQSGDVKREQYAMLVNESASKHAGPKMILEITEYGLGDTVVDPGTSHANPGVEVLND